MSPLAPSETDLNSQLGPARSAWDAILAAISERFGPVEQEWQPSKRSFGRMCLLKQGQRTLIYLTPEPGEVQVAVVLGERAVALALAGGLPASIEALIREARAYAEGRGIRFSVRSPAEVAVIAALVGFKTAPK